MTPDFWKLPYGSESLDRFLPPFSKQQTGKVTFYPGACSQFSCLERLFITMLFRGFGPGGEVPRNLREPGGVLVLEATRLPTALELPRP